MFSDPNIFGLQFSAAKDEFIEDVTSVVSGKEKKKKKKKKNYCCFSFGICTFDFHRTNLSK
jgi:hypothetical protein